MFYNVYFLGTGQRQKWRVVPEEGNWKGKEGIETDLSLESTTAYPVITFIQ